MVQPSSKQMKTTVVCCVFLCSWPEGRRVLLLPPPPSLNPSVCSPWKLTPWCQRGGISRPTGRPCSWTGRQTAARWHGCAKWNGRWRLPGCHISLPLGRHPKQQRGRKWCPGKYPSPPRCQHLKTPQKGGITPRRGRKKELVKHIFNRWSDKY